MTEVNEEYLKEVSECCFQLVGEFVLREGSWTEDTLREWRRVLNDDVSKIESVINHVHLTGFFWLSKGGYIDHEDLLMVGEKIRSSWVSTLASRFPDRTFGVVFDDGVLNDGWAGDMSVTACQVQKNA